MNNISWQKILVVICIFVVGVIFFRSDSNKNQIDTLLTPILGDQFEVKITKNDSKQTIIIFMPSKYNNKIKEIYTLISKATCFHPKLGDKVVIINYQRNIDYFELFIYILLLIIAYIVYILIIYSLFPKKAIKTNDEYNTLKTEVETKIAQYPKKFATIVSFLLKGGKWN